MYLLDTNAIVALLRNQPENARKRLRRAKAQGGALAVSSIALFELWYGVARSQHREKNTERLRVFLSGDVATVPFEDQPRLPVSCAGHSRPPGRRSARTTC
jgi:tRNA(fMet)-specific endonuclease VapC